MKQKIKEAQKIRYPTSQQPLPVRSMQPLWLHFAILFKKPVVYHYNLSAKMPLLKGAVHSLVEKEKTVVIFVVNFLTNGPITRWGGTFAYE